MSANSDCQAQMYDDSQDWDHEVSGRPLHASSQERHFRSSKRSLSGREKYATRARFSKSRRGRV